MNKQKFTIALATITLLTTVLFATPAAFAAGPSTNSSGNFFQGLISFISQKFGLDKTQVQTAINDYKTQNKPTPKPTLTPDQIQAQEKTRLDKLVSTGKITSAQETLILAELTALRAKYDPAVFKNLTAAQRKQQLQAEQAEIKTWASANGIDPKYVMPGFGLGRMGMGGLRGNHFGWSGHNLTPTPTP